MDGILKIWSEDRRDLRSSGAARPRYLLGMASEKDRVRSRGEQGMNVISVYGVSSRSES